MSAWRSAIGVRASAAGVELHDLLLDRLVAYVEVLGAWNRRINLTAFDLAAPSDAAIDRLLIEPLRAAPFIRDTARIAVDIGSGGGSPAIPIVLARPALQMTLVEARTRKAAFLREVARTLALSQVRVEAQRFEDVARTSVLASAVDLVTVRAVRADAALWAAADRLLQPAGEVYWFTEIGQIPETNIAMFHLIRRAGTAAVLTKIE